MKKEYVKPQIMFENFSLNTSISSCDMAVPHSQGGVNGCAIPNDNGIPGMDIFTTEVQACGVTEDDDEYNGFCYHVFDGNNMLFGS